MLRSLLVLLLAAPMIAAPKPQKEQLEPYYPIKVGTKRVYEMKSPDMIQEYTRVVEKVVLNDGVYRVSDSISGDKSTAKTQVYEVSSKGIAELFSPEKEDPIRFCLLKLPAKVGDEWVSEHQPGVKWTVLSIDEEVTVTAGTFKCIKIEDSLHSEGKETKRVTWYSRGVGVVKSEVTLSNNEIYIIQLKSLEPGK